MALMKMLENHGRIDFETIPPATGPVSDARLSTSLLFSENRGQMFGILLCTAPDIYSAPAVLKAFSGQYNGLWEVPGWAPPLIDPGTFENAVLKADPAIKELTAKISNLPTKSAERALLIDRRRELSRRHMHEIHEMYTIRNFAGESTDLFSLFKDRGGIPAGTGDCCAPKLLNHAIERGLKPLSLAEFYWGRDNRSGTRKHRRFYPPCNEKCRPLLEFMLVGTEFSGAGNA